MATLTETAYYTRRTIIFGVISLLAFIIIKFSFNLAVENWRRLHPPPPPPPDVAFQKIPKPSFPSQPNSKASFVFKLETITGQLPDLPGTGRVFFIPQKKSNLMAMDRANSKARQFGFSNSGEKVSDTTFKWVNDQIPPTTLEMDINTENFHIHYPYETDQQLLTAKNLPANQQAAQEAKSFLQTNSLLPEDLATGSAEFEYLRFIPPQLTYSPSLSEADYIRVNLFRADLDGLKIMPPDPKRSLISFLFSGSREPGKRIVEIDYNYSSIERETSGTYPLRTVQSAWQEVQAGNAYIANIGQNEQGNIIVRKVYLAYYDPYEPQNFLQPVYVFEGDRNFYAYVTAVDPKWLE